MIGIYFSGTGNTKYCLEKFVALYDRNIDITPLEDTGTMEKVTYHKMIADGRCTLCYRCVNQCSKKAITILGEQVIFQHSVSDYH